MRRFVRLTAALLAFAAPAAAFAQPSFPPPQYPCGRSTTACAQLAPRTNILTWLMNGQTDTLGTAGQFLHGSGGAAFQFVYEAPDDFSAVRVIYAGGGTQPWTLGQSEVTSNSQYGTQSGLLPFDAAGNADYIFAPLTFNAGGNNTLPYPGGVPGFTGNSTGGRLVIPLILGAATTTGNTTLNFVSTQTSVNSMVGEENPAAGMYVTDGLGCVPAGDTVSSYTTTTIALAAGVLAGSGGSGCQSGQLIWLSFAPINSLSVTLPPAPNSPQPVLAYSDWALISSQPRIDGAIVPNNVVAGSTSIPTGTTATIASTPYSIALSQALTGSVSGATQISVSATATTTTSIAASSATVPAQLTWPVSSTAGIQRGQQVSGTGVASGTYVAYVNTSNSTIEVNAAPSATIAAHTALTFSNLYKSGSTVNSGATAIPLADPADNHPLVVIRGFVASGQPWNHQFPLGGSGGYESNVYGTPNMVSIAGPQSGGSAVDIVNFPAETPTGGAASQSPVYAIQFLTRHNGIEVEITGDSHIAGQTSGSNAMGYARLAAYQASTPSIPIEVADTSHGGQAMAEWVPAAMDLIQAINPGIVAAMGVSTNGALWTQPETADLASMRQYVQMYGGRLVALQDYCKNSQYMLEVPVAQAVTNSAAVTLGANIPANSGTGAGFAVSWPGGPTGVTATLGLLSDTITLSAPETIQAGTLMDFNDISARVSNTSTSVTLATPSPYSLSANPVYDALGYLSSGTTITVTAGSTSATISPAATGSSTGDVVHVFTVEPGGSTLIRHLGNSLMRQAAAASNSTMLTFDAADIQCNPADQMYAGMSWDGLHMDDYGDAVAAAQFEPLLQRLIGN